MILKERLKEPYSFKDRADFVEKLNSKYSYYELKETETELQAWVFDKKEQEAFDIKNANEDRISQLESYLKSTDWIAIRFADTGEEMPADVKKARQDAREEISKLKKQQ